MALKRLAARLRAGRAPARDGRAGARRQRGAVALAVAALTLVTGAGISVSQPVPASAAAAVPIDCSAGVVYSVSASGQLSQIKNGTVTAVGTAASGVSSFNGLGIGQGGSPVYGYERNSTARTATIYSYTGSTGTWAKAADPYDTTTPSHGSYDGSLVAGAVSLASGAYMFGGFTANGTQFKIWKYASGTISYLGYINTSQGSGGATNGDMAFDAAGNLFVVRGSGTTTTVFSVTASNLASAAGGLITSSASNSFTTTSNVNGVAFDAAGKAYLGSGTTITSYNMPNWSNSAPVTSSLTNSTDLASCSSPATVTLQKNVVGRANAADQFGLSLKQGSTELGSATTAGSSTGIQDQTVGPLPTVAGATLTFAETPSGGANAADYASTWACTANGTAMSGASGTGTSGQVTIPTGSSPEVVCTFTNTPLVATVTIHKNVADASGNPVATAGWTVGSSPSATTGSVTQSPTATTQQTGADGNATWKLAFGSASSAATVAVSETQQSGYQFVSGQCAITTASGGSSTVTLTGAAAQNLTGVKPGDKVVCTYLNKKAAAAVVVNKFWKIGGQQYQDGDQPDGLSAGLTLSPAGSPADPKWGDTVTGFAVGDQVSIGETSSIDQTKLPGCTLSSATIAGDGISGTVALGGPTKVTLPGASNNYTVTNTVDCQKLTLVKKVDNAHGGDRAPADWNGRLHATPTGKAALNYDSGESKYVAAGAYALGEDQLAGYNQTGLTCTGGDLAGSTVTVGKGAAVTCTLTNSDLAGTVTWQKSDDHGQALQGSVWSLDGPGGASIDVEDCVAGQASGCTGTDKDPAAGSFKVDGLSWGDWALTEKKAPAGYVLDDTEHAFTIKAGQLDYAFDTVFTNKQRSAVMLPLTGGTGTDAFVLAGIVLLLGGGAAALLIRRRGKA